MKQRLKTGSISTSGDLTMFFLNAQGKNLTAKETISEPLS